MNGQTCSVCVMLEQIYEEMLAFPPSIFFSLWNYFVQVEFYLILTLYYVSCTACYWLIADVGFIPNTCMCMLSGCTMTIASHVGLWDKVLTRLKAAASVNCRGEAVK